MPINIIVAYSKKNRGIGKNNEMPWNLKSELKYFKELTCKKLNNQPNNILIMGRNTWESLPKKPLPNRINIILSKNMNDAKKEEIESTYQDTFVKKNLINCIDELKITYPNNNIFVIGGAQIYNILLTTELNLNLNLYVTEIYKEFDCDTFFPEIDENKFAVTSVSNFKEEKGINFRHKIYKSKNTIKQEEIWKNSEEMQYINTLKEIIDFGQENIDRTNVGTKSIFGEQYKYNLRDSFPALTTKRIFFRGIFEELMLYLTGKTNNKILNEKKIHIWDGNTTREFLDKRELQHYPVGDMGETYGFNFRHFGAKYINCNTDYSGKGTDQLANVIHLIKNDPHSRRIIINLWNASTLNNAALPACLCMYQFYVNTKQKELNLQIYIRSSDFFLANNWNACTGALFVHMICNLKDIDLSPGTLTVVTGDTHIYNSHAEQVEKNIERIPRPFPKLIIKEQKDKLEDFTYDDLQLIDYTPYKNISAPMAV